MATYNNLTSLEGLQVGDTITYNTTTAIDFKGYKVKVELYGQARSYNDITRGGGKTNFNIKYSGIFCFSTRGGCSLCYGNTYDAYYRIAVAGDAGNYGSFGWLEYAGLGGGLIGGSSKSDGSEATGGSQTAGGSYSSNLGTSYGNFGELATNTKITSNSDYNFVDRRQWMV